jgi:hypothetical protein
LVHFLGQRSSDVGFKGVTKLSRRQQAVDRDEQLSDLLRIVLSERTDTNLSVQAAYSVEAAGSPANRPNMRKS